MSPTPAAPDPKSLSETELREQTRRAVEGQKATPSDANTARVMGNVSEGSRRVHDLFSGVTESQSGAEGLVGEVESISTELIGSAEAKRIKLEERADYETILRGVLVDAGTLIRDIQVICADLKSADVSPEGVYSLLEKRLAGRTDDSSNILISLGKNKITSLLEKATDRRVNLDNALNEIKELKLDVPELGGIEKATRGGVRTALKVLMRTMRGAVAGVSGNALGGFGSVVTEGLEDGKEEALTTLTEKIQGGLGVLVAVGGKIIYCHQSNNGLEQVRGVVHNADDPYGVIGAVEYEEQKVSALIKELPAGYELTVQKASDGTEVTLKRNASGDQKIAENSLTALGAGNEKQLVDNPLKYLYAPKNFVQA